MTHNPWRTWTSAAALAGACFLSPAFAQNDTPATAADTSDAASADVPASQPASSGGESGGAGGTKPRINAALLGGVSPRAIGPAMSSGRVADLAVHPHNPSVVYAAVASGGVWKTVNRGTTWKPIFDSYGSFSIGCVAIDPNAPDTVWVGTGENNSQRSVSWGDGVYVSRDGGASFTNVGLKSSEHIGKIIIDPRDSRVVYVAAQGPLWGPGGERGLYKTTDAGTTWERILHLDDNTGVNEVHFDPRNPDVLYASAYQRRRHVWTLVNGGPGSGIYKSTDAGKTWKESTSGLPGTDMGRIGMAVSPANPDIVYAIVEAKDGEGGVFRSTNRGESWEKRSGYMTSSPQYYNEVIAHPTQPDTVYFLDTFMQVSTDGGASLRGAPRDDRHVDDHALWIDPTDPAHMMVGCDGGFYDTFDEGRNWRFSGTLPVTQFYRVGLDNSEPFYTVYGGTQDNNTMGGPSRTFDTAGIRNEDWFVTLGGDGFEVVVDPTDNNTVYCEYQDGGLVRYDRASGEQVDIRPRERPGDAPEVFNWDSPLIISSHGNKPLYFAGRRLWRSDDRGDSWRVISPDLTRGLDRNQLKVFDKIQSPDAVAKHMSTSIFGNAVALSESSKKEGLIYVGTDDGLIHVTEDGGASWRKIENFPAVPEMSYVSCVAASRHETDVVFATFDNHKMSDFKPYILKSEDRGRTWKPLATDLPAGGPVYVIAEDRINKRILWCGTEYGAFVSLNEGANWLKVPGLPTIAVRDIAVHERMDDVVFATFGRGFYIWDDAAWVRELNEHSLAKDAGIFPIREAVSFVRENRLSSISGKGWQGAGYFTAPNPPFGALITYHLRDKVTSLKETRKEDEKDGEFAYPTTDALRAEDRQRDPAVVVTIRDASGSIVRELGAPREAGLHRIAWDLRYPSAQPVSLSGPEYAPWDTPVEGPLAPEGQYSAEVSKVVDGVRTTLTQPMPFSVTALGRATLAAHGEAAAERFAFQRSAQALQRAVSGALANADRAQSTLAHIRKAIGETPGIPDDLLGRAEALRVALDKVQVALRGDPTLGRRYEPQSPSIADRAGYAIDSTLHNTSPIGGQAKEQLAYAETEFQGVLADLNRLIETDLAALEQALNDAGAPHTPGRKVQWKK